MNQDADKSKSERTTHPERFPIKPQKGHKGGSIPWEDAEIYMRVWQKRFGKNSTDYRTSIMKVAASGGIEHDLMMSLARELNENLFHSTGTGGTYNWEKNFCADDFEEWKASAQSFIDLGK